MNLKERKAIIAGNWKLNKRVAEIPAFTQELQANLPAERCCDVVICATYPLIAALETAGQAATSASARRTCPSTSTAHSPARCLPSSSATSVRSTASSATASAAATTRD